MHAIRNLARIGFGTTAVRYSQLGFGRTSSTSRAQTTPRNLFGFKDGTNNLKLEDTDKLEQFGCQPEDGPEWMVGGSYLVSRRIRMTIETWDRTSLSEQETIVGRGKGTGAPLGKAEEFDEIDFTAKGSDGEPKVAEVAHVRLAHPQFNDAAAAPGLQLRRRFGRARPARCRAVLPCLPAGSAQAVHPDPAAAGPLGRDERVHPPRRFRHLRLSRRRPSPAPSGARSSSPESRYCVSRPPGWFPGGRDVRS